MTEDRSEHRGQAAGYAGAPRPLRPIFIGGCSRSGTTMLGALLGAHSRCVCVPEMPFKFVRLRRVAWGDGGAPVAAVADQLAWSYKFRLWGVDEGRLGETGEERIGYREAVERVVRLYAERTGRSEADVWVDHTPGNIRAVTRLLEDFPDASFVHIIRDGRAVAASLLPLEWGRHTITGAAEFWVRQLGYGLAAEEWAPDRVTRVHYEDLLRAPRDTMRFLCEAIGLAAEDHLGTQTRYSLPKATQVQHALVRHAPRPERATAWKESLSSRQIEIFESMAGEVLKCLGYELEFGPDARSPTRLERLGDGLREPLYGLRRLPNDIRNYLFRRFGIGSLAADFPE